MARFLARTIVSTIATMLLVSMVLFALIEVGSGDIAVKILGVFSTEEQRESFRLQLGLDRSAGQRYVAWLVGSDFSAEQQVGYDLVTLPNPRTDEAQWWAVTEDGSYVQWQVQDGILERLVRQEDGTAVAETAPDEWIVNPAGEESFWGINSRNSAVRWVRGSENIAFVRTQTGTREEQGAPIQYIPLRKGLLRGDAGQSFQSGRPVSETLVRRLSNTAVLAGAAFAIVMPLALLLGIVAGVNEGKAIDRIISIGGLALTATPEFVTGVFLILIFGIWLEWFPAVSVFLSDDALFREPSLLALPVLTLTAVELGYVARITRASMVEVMNAPYIRTAIIKGMPFWRVVWRHAVRNALMAPITIIMLHINWLIGGVVVVEVIFGFPGLGSYIYDAAVFGDINAVMAAAMVTVLIAVATRLLGDLAYTFLNPRIRYAN